MSFLAPWYIPAIAAAAAIPPLVLLYFLKLRRKEISIPSTLLWKQAIQDLQVNAPFQRLRSNLLLFLQLLILALAALAIAEPILGGSSDLEQSVVLVIDRSASMSTQEKDGQTRLDIACEEAINTIDGLSTASRAMIITFADRALVLCPFTDDKNRLREAVRSITPTDAPGRLHEAMQLAEAHSTPLGENIYTQGNEGVRSRFVLFTDGRLPDADKLVVQRGQMEVSLVGQAAANLGFVGLDIRRQPEKPEQVNIVARVRNFGPPAESQDVSLFVDGTLRDARTLADLAGVDPQQSMDQIQLPAVPAEGSEAMLAFDLVIEDSATVELRLSKPDAFSTDNQAFGIVPPQRNVRALLVTSGNRYLRDLITALPLAERKFWTPEEYENAPEEALTDMGRCKFDVVIFDGCSTRRLPPGQYLFFGGIPLLDGYTLGEKVSNQAVLDWDAAHPVLRHVAVEAMNVFAWQRLTTPPEATTLIESSAGPMLSFVREERRRFLLCAFNFFDEQRETLNTSWIFDESLVVFMHNALRYLAGAGEEIDRPFLYPGEAIFASVRPGLSKLNIRRPADQQDQVNVRADGLVSYSRTDEVGLYQVEAEGIDRRDWAVNLMNDQESFVAVYRDFHIAGGQVQAGKEILARHRPLWPYALLILCGVLMLEWFIYNKRVWI